MGGYTAQGGKSVKHGVLLRTAELSGAASTDILRLQNVYNLAVIADLRMSHEVAQLPDPVIQGAKYLHLKIMDEAALMKDLNSQDLEALRNGDKVGMLIRAVKRGVVGEHMYIDFLSGEQGKDRTGCAAMLILAALGVGENTILADFALTNHFNAELIKAQREMLVDMGYSGSELDKIMKAFYEVDPQYLVNAINWLRENYGSSEGAKSCILL
ncbi:MAG: tyrosine-protein phosphatase [Prevotella sp.]|nr:tyrosine-protein phosphatase [Prevotella sp.]